MHQALPDILISDYGLHDPKIAPAPRQYVAETYKIETPDQPPYFCKIVDKSIWIPKIIGSLPVLDSIYKLGFARANYPIKTLSGAFYVMADNTLIVLFNFIEGRQREDFDDTAFGQLLGEVHALTRHIVADIPQEPFKLKHRDLFEQRFDDLLGSDTDDEVLQGLQRVLKSHEREIRRHYAVLQRLIKECTQTHIDLVMTHGDPGGNVLMKSPTDLYLIDWDEILLAPAERDIWIHDQRPAFMAGYRRIFPEYRTNELARAYCLCSQHFDYMAYYLSDILGNLPAEHRAAKLRDFEGYFEGWIKPYLEAIS